MTGAVAQSEPWPVTAEAIASRSSSLDERHAYIDRLATPVWIFDVDNSRVAWANQSALEVWRAETLAELTARDLAKDMSISVAKRLRQYQEDFEKKGATFSELWTIYPKGGSITLRVAYSGIRLWDGRMAM